MLLSTILFASIAIFGTVIRAQNDQIDTLSQSLFQLIKNSDETQLVSHHLEIPALEPIKHLLSNTIDRKYTIFLPTNNAIIQSLQGVYESFCEQSNIDNADRETNISLIKHKPFKATSAVRMPSMTDFDCQNLFKMISMDEQLMKNLQRTHKYYQKRMDLSNQYRQLKFSPQMEQFYLASVAYHIVPKMINVDEIQTNTNQALRTLACGCSFNLGNFTTATKLILHKGNEGGLSLIFASPQAPVCCADVRPDSVQASNGQLFFINQAWPLPYSLSPSLVYNNLLITHALLNYTGLLDEFDQRMNYTFLAPTDQSLLNALPSLLQNRDIKQMIANECKHHQNMLKMPITEVMMKRAALHHQRGMFEWIHSAKRHSEQLLKLVQSKEDSSDSDAVSIDKNSIRKLLSNHLIDGTFFTSDLKSIENVPTIGRQNLPVESSAVDGDEYTESFKIGNAKLLYSDIPIFNGALHIVDSVIQPE